MRKPERASPPPTWSPKSTVVPCVPSTPASAGSSRRTGCYQRRQPCAGWSTTTGSRRETRRSRYGSAKSSRRDQFHRRSPRSKGPRSQALPHRLRRAAALSGPAIGKSPGTHRRGAMGLCRCQSQRGHANDGRGPTKAMESDNHFVLPLGPRACDADLPRVVVIPILTHRLIPAGGASGNFALREVYPV